jgi:hypothetical protein
MSEKNPFTFDWLLRKKEQRKAIYRNLLLQEGADQSNIDRMLVDIFDSEDNQEEQDSLDRLKDVLEDNAELAKLGSSLPPDSPADRGITASALEKDALRREETIVEFAACLKQDRIDRRKEEVCCGSCGLSYDNPAWIPNSIHDPLGLKQERCPRCHSPDPRKRGY